MSGLMLIGLVVSLAAVAVIGIDIYLAVTGGFKATLSYWMMSTSAKYPILPAALCLVIGILVGHFFWSQQLNVTVQECSK